MPYYWEMLSSVALGKYEPELELEPVEKFRLRDLNQMDSNFFIFFPFLFGQSKVFKNMYSFTVCVWCGVRLVY